MFVLTKQNHYSLVAPSYFSQEARNHLQVHALAGAGSGVVLSFLSTPIGFVKIQQQVSIDISDLK